MKSINKKVEEAYNILAKEYDLARTKNTGLAGFQNREVEQPIMKSLLPKNLKKMKILDVGCGSGIHAKEYIKRGAIVTGIDISEELLKLARKRCSAGIFLKKDVQNLKLKDDFNLVVSSMTFPHVKDLNKSFKEINKVLCKNGLFIFSIPHPLTYIFKLDDKNQYFINHSYFEKSIYYFNQGRIPCYRRTLDEYFNTLIKNDFTIEKFIENKPKLSWLNKYKEFKNNGKFKLAFEIPLICFFVCRKK